MRITIRVPSHPLALQSAWSGLAGIGEPDIERGGGAWWLHMRVEDKPPALNRALEVFVRINVLLMRAWQARGHQVPSIYELAAGGFRYKPEPRGREWWQTFVDNIDEGSGDCEDLAGHQAGFYRAELAIPARAVTKKTGAHVYHAVVEHPGGAIEDPSLPLGLAEYRMRRRQQRQQRSA